jgi:hypothetical protein
MVSRCAGEEAVATPLESSTIPSNESKPGRRLFVLNMGTSLKTAFFGFPYEYHLCHPEYIGKHLTKS